VTAPVLAATVDAFLGGRVAAIQPVGGHHRSGLDAVLLAAAVEAGFAGTVVDLGAGTGVAGFAVAARCARARVVLVERDPDVAECAVAALARPENRAFAARVTVIVGDIREMAASDDRLTPASADAVIMNPPFHDAGAGTAPPLAPRRAAYVLEDDGLDAWFRAALTVLKPHGALALIYRADRLDDVLAACRRRIGGIAVLPIAPRVESAATRIIVCGTKGSRAPLRLLPALTLHGPTANAFLPGPNAVLRDGAALSEVSATWTGVG
jgi:tRNA1(Val) A37 N6-methylase TrmN6